MGDEQEFPPVSKALVEKLEGFFPDRCPEPKMSDREIWMAVGAAKVVALLREHFNRQQEPEER